jgi:hypothetical protein
MKQEIGRSGLSPSNRVAGVCRVINDGDIIFANLSQLAKYGVRKFVVSDMRSHDNTRAEVERFASANPDATVFIVDDPGYNILGSKIFTGLSAFAAHALEVSWIVPFDADDILWLAPNVTLDLEGADIDYVLLPWLQVHPAAFAAKGIADYLNRDHLGSVVELAVSPGKMMFRWAADLVIERGHHWLHSTNGRVLRGVRGAEVGAAMAHFPIRTAEQFLAKISSGAAAEKRAQGSAHATHHSALGTILQKDGEQAISRLIDAMWRKDQISFQTLCAQQSVDPRQLSYLSDLVMRDGFDFRGSREGTSCRSLSDARKILSYRRKDNSAKLRVDVSTRLHVALLRALG